MSTTLQQQRAARVLAAGGSRQEAADAADCHIGTVSRWKLDEPFEQLIEHERENVSSDHDQVRTRLLSIALASDDKLSIAAAHELREWLGNPSGDAAAEVYEEDPDFDFG